MELSLMAAQQLQAVSWAFMDSPYNGNTSLQTSTSNLNTSFSRPAEQEEDGKVSSDAIWLWVAVIATIGNIVVVAVVCACAF
ncbi:uncharacterized protein C14orf132 [Carassius auratus]|uniref:Uncharacterized protein C14orf132 n=1 Tax=Carassius auratus TaxID=7957 RepID=A0A6P6RFQ9_CARAU|nr:uncharacterized protein C14orf132-like [Carassius auratus]